MRAIPFLSPCRLISNVPFVPAYFLVACLVAAASGCAAKPKVAQRPPPKPWLHARSLCVFPMSQPVSPGASPEVLASSLEQGWEARLNVPDGLDLVRVDGAQGSARLDALTIDLSDVAVPKNRKKTKLKPVGQVEGALHVDHLELVARPLLVEKSKLLLAMSASDAKLEMRRDKHGRPMLTLSGAEHGHVTMEMSRKDIDALLLHSAREGAGKYGVSVDKINLNLDLVEGRTLRADLKIDTRIGGLLPAGLRFKARVDVDDQLNGKVTRLSCEGDQLLGPIISGIIEPNLKKYEGKKRPLMGFAFGNMRLRHFDVWMDDAFHVEARFGDVPPASAAPRRPRLTI